MDRSVPARGDRPVPGDRSFPTRGDRPVHGDRSFPARGDRPVPPDRGSYRSERRTLITDRRIPACRDHTVVRERGSFTGVAPTIVADRHSPAHGDRPVAVDHGHRVAEESQDLASPGQLALEAGKNLEVRGFPVAEDRTDPRSRVHPPSLKRTTGQTHRALPVLRTHAGAGCATRTGPGPGADRRCSYRRKCAILLRHMTGGDAWSDSGPVPSATPRS